MLVAALYLVLLFYLVAEIRVCALAGIFLIGRARARDAGPSDSALPLGDAALPSVVVQLPVYRECRVLRRLLSAVMRLQYPDGKLTVQVLDDSEGHEARLTQEIVSQFSTHPIPIEYVHRTRRVGYKSGALNCGNERTGADLVAIFDADFIPQADFLIRTVPYFRNPRVGAVHTRWRHLNDSVSPLAMLQAAVLDSLFCFANGPPGSTAQSSMYLGTSGVWRRRLIEDLGGWREAPFTDDGLDLSFRAQIAGWSLVYLDQPLSSAELPETYLAYKSQQRRWARAALRVCLDYGAHAVGRGAGARIRFLEISSLHLVLSTPCLLLAALVTGLAVSLGVQRTAWWLAAQVALMVAAVALPAAQEVILSQKLLYPDWVRRSSLALRALPLAVGVSVSILAGFWDTIVRSDIEFVTTPKQGADAVIRSSPRRWLNNALGIAGLEVLAGGVALAGFIAAFVRGYPEACFLLLFVAGAFAISAWTSFQDVARKSGVRHGN